MPPDDSQPPETPAAAPSLPRQVFNYLWRATYLKCPVCGTRPLFLPLKKVRRLNDWLSPLDGCPRCGYAYDREPGYFLLAQWGLGYGVSAVVGILIYAYLQFWHPEWSLTATILAVMLPLPFVNFLFARHAKAYFLAIDHLCDPHIPDLDQEEDGGGGDGGSRLLPKRPVSPNSPASPDPAGQPGSGIDRERGAARSRPLELAGKD